MKELIIELTNRCINNCIHCSSKNCGAGKIYDINIDAIADFVNYIIGSGFDTIVFSGGEPLLHPQIESLIKYFKNRDVFLKIYTSGVVDSKTYAAIKSKQLMNYFNKIVVSCYSHIEATHNSITRNPNSYLALNNFISSCINDKNKIEINVVPMANNVHDLTFIHDKYINDISQFNVLKLVKQGNASSNWEELIPDAKALNTELNILRNKIKTKIGNSFGTISNSAYKCEAGKSKLCITFDGYIIPCEVFKSIRKQFRHYSYYIDNNLLLMDMESYAHHNYARGCQAGTICHGQ